jgi:GNAT superfamily N-acetyltransferase
MTEFNLKDIEIVRCNETHDMTQFCCKIPDLNDFLKDDANKQKEAMLNVTYLALYDKKVIAYFTLSTDNIKISNLQENYGKKFKGKNVYYKIFPAIKIGRFGVDENYENKGVGKFLFQWIIHYSLKISKKIGFRFITIDSYGSAYEFYKKMRCRDALKDEKIKNKLEEFKRHISQNDYDEAYKITILLFFDLYEFNTNLLLKD